MAIDPDYELTSSDELNFDSESSSSELENDIADFELTVNTNEGKSSRRNEKRIHLAKKKIEQLQEERRLRRLNEDYYDDWD
ncbi:MULTISPECIES: PA3496 family putative envelope integrity protein [unclassified Pseudoalteromonas]|uniref:PA3496 family putative envelope integrity protein n=1 Tax=unclassified Pseudoalteromonas TaxID=194690 RepID=UPI0005A8A315|nr:MULTISPECIES: hypothetical protein [unclassified Pseudoalteromonas]